VRAIRRDPLGFYARLREQYGDFVYQRFGPFQDYTALHPDLVKEVLVTKAKHFHKMAWQREVFAQWNGNSVLLSEGDEWLRQRRMVQPAFAPRRFQNYGHAMVACTRHMLATWKGEVEIVQAMTDLTLTIIAKTMFDLDLTAEARQIGEAVGILNDVAMYEMMHPLRLPNWLPTAYNRQKRWAIGLLNQTIRDMIRARRASREDHGDLLSMLLLAVDEEGDGQAMDDEQVRSQAMTLLLAGHDTTAAGLAWVFYVLARYPAVQTRAVHELETVVGDRLPTAADVPQLAFAEMLIKETLRLYPPAIGTFGRQAVVDTEIGGYPIRKGSVVRTLSYPLHHDARFFPDPERFDPERFAPERVGQLKPYSYFPFGVGPRVCIGNTFAMTEMTLIMATVLQRFRIALAADQKEPRLSVKLSLRPEGGLRLALEQRTPVLVGANP
jgi:cytochrome P450